MQSLPSFLGGFAAVAFSGSRSCPLAVAAASSAFPLVGPAASVSVGCAAGVDHAARLAFGQAVVFRAPSFRAASFAGRLVLRSVACVRSVAPGGLVVVAPSAGQPCPVCVVPSGSWSGGGSGSWASAALALGLGCSVLLWVSPGVSAPRWASAAAVASWPCAAGGSWLALVPPPSPPSLFS